jgi:hypothetical protein
VSKFFIAIPEPAEVIDQRIDALRQLKHARSLVAKIFQTDDILKLQALCQEHPEFLQFYTQSRNPRTFLQLAVQRGAFHCAAWIYPQSIALDTDLDYQYLLQRLPTQCTDYTLFTLNLQTCRDAVTCAVKTRETAASISQVSKTEDNFSAIRRFFELICRQLSQFPIAQQLQSIPKLIQIYQVSGVSAIPRQRFQDALGIHLISTSSLTVEYLEILKLFTHLQLTLTTLAQRSILERLLISHVSLFEKACLLYAFHVPTIKAVARTFFETRLVRFQENSLFPNQNSYHRNLTLCVLTRLFSKRYFENAIARVEERLQKLKSFHQPRESLLQQSPEQITREQFLAVLQKATKLMTQVEFRNFANWFELCRNDILRTMFLNDELSILQLFQFFGKLQPIYQLSSEKTRTAASHALRL